MIFIRHTLKKPKLAPILLFFIFCHCSQDINMDGETIGKRFIPPAGYERVEYAADSFQVYIRNLPLKKYGSPVLLYNGTIKRKDVHISVLEIPILHEDLIQCADAVMKIRAEYLYSARKYDEIAFTITNGMNVRFTKYAQGYRIGVKGNRSSWRQGRYRRGFGREVFDEYMKFIYTYSGTLSLSRELKPVNVNDIRIGDVFIEGGSPGHAVIVADLAVQAGTGKKVMLLAQSYMPSQEIHILKSFDDISPWYHVQDADLATPEWYFDKGSLMRF